MFHLCCKQNKGKPADVRKALLNAVPHSHGEHDSCGEWCGYLRNPERYKHETLPFGRDLTDLKLKERVGQVSIKVHLRKEKSGMIILAVRPERYLSLLLKT